MCMCMFVVMNVRLAATGKACEQPHLDGITWKANSNNLLLCFIVFEILMSPSVFAWLLVPVTSQWVGRWMGGVI